MNNVKCLNPWDPQSKRQYGIDGVYATLNAGQSQGGQAHGVCYAIEGNVVDRVSAKNGKGWCEDVSPTLNTQDRHAVVFAIDQQGGKGNCNYMQDVMPTLLSDSHGTPHAICFQLCGDRDNPSVSTSDKAYCIPANPMSDRGQAVCIALEENGARPSHMGKGFSEDGTMYTLNTIEQHSVCYSVDCRNLYLNEEKSATLQAKNEGGHSLNFLNPVLMERTDEVLCD